MVVVADFARLALANRLGQSTERGVGNDRGILAITTLQLFDLAFEHAADLEATFSIALLEGDWQTCHARHTPDQRAKVGQVAAGLTREDRPECLGLLRIGSLVQIEGQLPSTVGHLLW